MNKFKILTFVLCVSIFYFLGFTLVDKFNLRNFSEIGYLKNKNLNFSELDSYFKDVAEAKGGVYAFDLLKVADLPPNTDIHLLAHTIGNVLFKQKGIRGISLCTPDFRNACSHSIVIGVLINSGISALSQISDVCKSAPGGDGAYGMCFHGLGHGVLAYSGYDMIRAVELCQRIGTKELNFIETSECVGGVMMEMIGGVHDQKAWEAQKDNYFKKGDPLFPCNQKFIPLVAKYNCYNYLTPHLWEVSGTDLGNPTEEDFSKSFGYCSKVSHEEEIYKEACYGGFGKEFVTLVQSRDIRKIDQMTDSQLSGVYNWCKLAIDPLGVVACLKQAVNSLYWGGENDPKTAVMFCGLIGEKDNQDQCFGHLSGAFKYYNRNDRRLSNLCKLLPNEFAQKCLTRDENTN